MTVTNAEHELVLDSSIHFGITGGAMNAGPNTRNFSPHIQMGSDIEQSLTTFFPSHVPEKL